MSQRKRGSGKPRPGAGQAPWQEQPDTRAAARAAADQATKGMRGTYLRAFVFFMLAAAVILFAIVQLRGDDSSFPGTDSAEAGFARDMKTHHAQAVEMAGIVHERLSGSDTPLHFFLTDMTLTQTNQMGQMEAWLNIWGLPQGSAEPPMAWMGHEVTGLMPGMATDEQINELRTLPENEMVTRFMQLMIVHHQSAVEMANAIIERSDNEVVLRLADSIVRTQQAEIDRMNLFIQEYGGAPSGAPAAAPGASPVASPEHQH
jgi:uncharacterized protein (DUF305 family)